MPGKNYTVLIIPNEKSGTRRFGVTKRALWLGLFVILALAGSSTWIFLDRVNLVRQLEHLPPLQEQARSQRAILDQFNTRLQDVDNNLLQLRKLEERLRIMASIRPREGSDDFGVGGVVQEELPPIEGLQPSERRLVTRLNRQFADLEKRTSGQKSALTELIREFRKKRVLLAHTPSISPVRGWLTSAFGNRKSLFTNRREFHAGIDIVARKGQPIAAAADGVVIRTGREEGYGNVVEIRHIQGIITRYAHNNKNLVKRGQRVRRGDIIATVGSTGRSTGPHLHYEIRLNKIAVNPMLYIVDNLLAKN